MLPSEKQVGDGDLQPTSLNFLACIDLYAGSVTVSVRLSVRLSLFVRLSVRGYAR